MAYILGHSTIYRYLTGNVIIFSFPLNCKLLKRNNPAWPSVKPSKYQFLNPVYQFCQSLYMIWLWSSCNPTSFWFFPSALANSATVFCHNVARWATRLEISNSNYYVAWWATKNDIEVKQLLSSLHHGWATHLNRLQGISPHRRFAAPPATFRTYLQDVLAHRRDDLPSLRHFAPCKMFHTHGRHFAPFARSFAPIISPPPPPKRLGKTFHPLTKLRHFAPPTPQRSSFTPVLSFSSTSGVSN